jgi:hypothetical protein
MPFFPKKSGHAERVLSFFLAFDNCTRELGVHALRVAFILGFTLNDDTAKLRNRIRQDTSRVRSGVDNEWRRCHRLNGGQRRSKLLQECRVEDRDECLGVSAT